MYACMTLGALKELLYQVVIRDWDTPEEKLVDEVVTFLRRGYLRVEDVTEPPVSKPALAKKTPKRRAS